jgi:hypothetical protein
MLCLSEILLQEHDLISFEQLIESVKRRALGGAMFFRIDVKPPFQDTPVDWEDRLEAAFSTAMR